MSFLVACQVLHRGHLRNGSWIVADLCALQRLGPGDVFHLRRLRQCPCDDMMFLRGERRRHVKAPGQCTVGGKWSQSEGWKGLAKRHLKTGSIQMRFMAGDCQEMQSD